MDEPLLAPQLVVGSRMLHFGWIPADPAAAATLVPEGLTPAPNRGVYINQYVVDAPDQTSGFGAYSLTYLGVELEGLDAPGGGAGRFWTHYFNSSERMRAYARERGVPATLGETVIEIAGSRLVATSFSHGTPVIRSEARVGSGTSESASGHLRYITKVGDGFVSGRYAFTAGLTADSRSCPASSSTRATTSRPCVQPTRSSSPSGSTRRTPLSATRAERSRSRRGFIRRDPPCRLGASTGDPRAGGQARRLIAGSLEECLHLAKRQG